MPTIDTLRAMAATSPNPDDSITIIVHTLVKSFRPLYVDLIVTCIWSAMLVPLFIVLIFFSNRDLRRKPVFIGNVFAIILGIVLAGVLMDLTITVLLDPLVPPRISLFLAYVGLLAFSPNVVESILLIRLWAVYPFRTTPRKIFLAVFIPIMIIKVGRFINMAVYIIRLARRVNDGEDTISLLRQTWTTFPEYKIEWSLQVVDNTIASALFLAKLNKGRALRSATGGRLPSTLESLFWIAVYNFVIPVILSIVELIVIFTNSDIFQVLPIVIVNLYVEIIGVLLATVWAAGTRWQDSHKSSGSGVELSTVEVDIVDLSAMSPVNSAGRTKRTGAL